VLFEGDDNGLILLCPQVIKLKEFRQLLYLLVGDEIREVGMLECIEGTDALLSVIG
jgi:hypothetical protein